MQTCIFTTKVPSTDLLPFLLIFYTGIVVLSAQESCEVVLKAPLPIPTVFQWSKGRATINNQSYQILYFQILVEFQEMHHCQ